VAALLLGLAQKTSEADDDRNVVIKAVIINAAVTTILDQAGRPTDPNGGVTVWNPDRGFGRIDALGSYNILKAGRISRDVQSKVTMGWAYSNLSPGIKHVYRIHGRKNTRLVCTLVWNRKVVWNDRRSRGFIDVGELKGVPSRLDFSVAGAGIRLGIPIASEAPHKDNVVKYDAIIPEDGVIVLTVGYGAGDNDALPYGVAFELRS
jgi:hypothetical protein